MIGTERDDEVSAHHHGGVGVDRDEAEDAGAVQQRHVEGCPRHAGGGCLENWEEGGRRRLCANFMI